MNDSPNVFYVSFCLPGDTQVPFYDRDGLGIAFDPDVLRKLARRLQLIYLPEESLHTEMCFLHSPGLRPEFKLSFNLRDFTDFVRGVLREQGQLEGLAALGSERCPIPYPEDPDVFWKMVAAGAVNR